MPKTQRAQPWPRSLLFSLLYLALQPDGCVARNLAIDNFGGGQDNSSGWSLHRLVAEVCETLPTVRSAEVQYFLAKVVDPLELLFCYKLLTKS